MAALCCTSNVSCMTAQREVSFTPLQLLRRLAALVPPARWNQTRYFGVFAPSSKLRRRVVPARAPSLSPRATPTTADAKPSTSTSYRLPWAALLARTFLVDILKCACGGERKVLAFVPEALVAQAVLRRLGLPGSPPPVAPSRWASQDEFELTHQYDGVDPPFYDEAT